MKKSLVLKSLFAGLMLAFNASCSNLFDDFLNEDGFIKTGDTSLTAANGTSSGTGGTFSPIQSNTNPSGSITINKNPEEYYIPVAANESTNTDINNGLVVIKATRPNYNQINYSSSQHEYEVGNENTPYLSDKDDPVQIKTFTSNSYAKVSYTAIQTRTTNLVYENENYVEEFVDLPSTSPVTFSLSYTSDNLLTFPELPYGTTLVTVTITADDAYYTDSYTIKLNKKHASLSLSKAENNAEKLTKGLVVLKESDGFNHNQINYSDETFNYEASSLLTGNDKNVYFKAIPADANADVEWTAVHTANPVYKYEYYKTVTTTVVKVDSNGMLISGPTSTSETSKTGAYAEKTIVIEETTDAAGSTTTKTVTTIVRKSITGLDHMEAVTEEDISSSLKPVENQNTDRVRIAELPVGTTVVTAAVKSGSGANQIVKKYTITLSKVQFEDNSSKSSSSSSETVAASSVQDDTSKLEDLSVTAVSKSDDNGNSVNQESEPETNFTFDKDKTIYSVVVSENTDEIIINPKLSENETMTNPVSKTKYSELKSNSNTVIVQGGLQVISFTVTEEGFDARTYYLYVYKTTGNTRLETINYTSYNCINKASTAGTIAAANYEAGTGSFVPGAVYASNGGDPTSPKLYKLNVRADDACDVSKMTFSILPYDSHTHIFYYAGETCPAANGSEWSRGYLASDSGNSYTFDLKNEGETAKTSLWIKTESRAYIHASDLSGNSVSAPLATKDITYHKVEISKPGNKNLALKELFIKTVNESGQEAELYSDLDTKDNAGITHIAGTLSKNVGTEIDIAKVYFRLADKTDSTDSKDITYSIKNVRASSTESTPNNDFTKSEVTTESVNGKKYYVVTLGEIEGANDNASATVRTTKDLPMGTTTFTININGKKSTDISFVKPDLDCHTLQAKPALGSGSSGVYTTSFYDTVYYLNNDVKEVDLTMTTTQKNEKIEVLSYEKTAGENGTESTETYDIKDENINITQSTEVPYTTWTSQIKNIPVGTSQVKYKITSANGEGSTECKVTLVRAEDIETRLRSYNVSGPASASEKQSISRFDWNSTGTAVTGSENTYKNSYELKDAKTGTYTITALPINDNEKISVKVYGSKSESVAENLSENTISASTVTGTTGSYTFNIESEWNYILVRVTVTNGTEIKYTHYYDTLISVALEKETGITAAGKQYYSGDSSEADTLNYTKKTENSETNASGGLLKTIIYNKVSTNVNNNGNISLTISKSAKANWSEGYPKVTIGEDETGTDISSSVNIDSNKNISIPYAIYSKYTGKTISVTYMASAEFSVNEEKHVFPIHISALEAVTTYKNWSNSTTYTYTLPDVTNKKQLAFRFGSEITDETNIIKKLADNKNVKNGGLDVLGSLNSGAGWGATSFNFSGMHYLVKLDSDVYLAKLEAASSSSDTASATAFYKLTAGTGGFDGSTSLEIAKDTGLSLSVKASVCYDGETPYLVVNNTLNNSTEKSVSLGLIMDTLVAEEGKATDAKSDSVAITKTNNGFSMAGSGYKFSVFLKNALGVDDVTRFWYGEYNSNGKFNYLKTAFETTNSSLSSGQDSALSFSWDLGNSNSESRTFRLTVE